MMASVSIILVNYNGVKIGVLPDSLRSILDSTFRDFELIIVDNGSSDASVGFLNDIARKDSRVKVLFMDHNLGYSAANNYAVRHTHGRYLAFLHNDAQVREDWLDTLLPAIEMNDKVGAVQPQIRDLADPMTIISEGNLIDRLGFVTVERFGERTGLSERPRAILAATAACMLFKRRAFELAGGFDETYFFSYDEIDLCWRTWLAGYEIYYVPRAIVWHKASTTVNRYFRSEVSYLDSKNRLTSMMKNFGAALLTTYFVPSILATAFVAMRKILRKDVEGAAATFRGIWDTFTDIGETLQHRQIVQNARRIDDSFLLQEGLISPVVFSKLFARTIEG